ncbi:BrnT family toxin [Bradyrhizobium diazoefficiens]|uniref:BrnT family toxin n=1 Tax=Bradyrhizobium diazoefficiens TaxID=1355477 RepID=UPI00190B277B|nr:BrnT family toxin [Bradyrhizobium diazoefficiens]QQO11543.1 BrnT family toxin [Bradyrhizobium diazoefficiens]
MSDFDPAKDAANVAKHSISLARWSDMEIRAVVPVEPFDHGDPRYRAYGFIDGVAHCLVFTIRSERYRPISLRRAHAKEMKRYVAED